jgi:N-acetylglutamate synthase-like GNAT family acetyltransferase
MEAIIIRKATEKGIKALSRKIGKLLEDKTGKLYQDNVVKFGIPEEYGKKVFSEEVLVEAARSGKATFYLALRNRREILGFAQIVEHDPTTVELDRIVVFPEYERMGIGTKLLKRAIADQKKRVRTLIVKAGRDEAHARAFYEKNGFKKVKEETLKSPWGKEIPLVEYCFQLASG